MPTTREVSAAHAERLRRQGKAAARKVLMRRGPNCPRCGKPTQALLVEASGQLIHPACFTVAEEPPVIDVPLPPS